MRSHGFKELLTSVGPDKLRNPSPSRAARGAGGATPTVPETLEARRLFTLTVSNAGGVLSVTGTSASEDIDVWSDGSTIHVQENDVDVATFAHSAITSNKISVSGAGGNDTITLWGGTQWTVPFPSSVYGGDGDDDIQGGDFNDTIYGGIGYDTIRGWDGNDKIYGGTGSGSNSDSVTGYDSLLGDAGADSIYGEGGFDTIRGGSGADYMYGGDGSDAIDAIGGDDNSADILDGGIGTDCGWWTALEDSASNMEGNLA